MYLPDNELHLHYVRPDEVADAKLAERYKALLTDDDERQMSRFYFKHHKRQFLFTRALVRSCLSLYHDVRPDEWCFEKNTYEKPHVAGPDCSAAVHFNISHANGLIICGLSRKFHIGVDVEDSQRNTQTPFKRLSSYFSDREIKALERLPGDARTQRFFDIWTLKESYIKARGGGLSIPLKKFSFEFTGDQLTGFYIDSDMDDHPGHWQFWRLSAPPAYSVAIAVNANDSALKLRTYHSVPLMEPKPGSLLHLSRYPDCISS